MCHVVPLRKNKEAKETKPISQIPLLGLIDERSLPNEPVRTNFRPTDTPLVRLSKMGGRKDLLCFRENDPNRGYTEAAPSCDWYYLEDNAFNDLSKEAEKEKYEFKVPSYMMSKPCRPCEELSTSFFDTHTPRHYGRVKVRAHPLPDSRPGYAEYNKPIYKPGIARREYIFPSRVKFPKVRRRFWYARQEIAQSRISQLIVILILQQLII